MFSKTQGVTIKLKQLKNTPREYTIFFFLTTGATRKHQCSLTSKFFHPHSATFMTQ